MEWTCYKSINKVYIGAVSGEQTHSTPPDAGVLQNKQSRGVVSASSSGSGTYCHFLQHHQLATNNKLGSWRPFQIEHSEQHSVGTTSHYHRNYPTGVLPLPTGLARVSSWFDLRNVHNTATFSHLHHTWWLKWKGLDGLTWSNLVLIPTY